MIILLFPVFDWRIIMIGPGGLLLVVSHLFCSLSFRVNGWGWKNQTWILTWILEIFLQGNILNIAGDALI